MQKARDIAALYLKQPYPTRRNTRIHFMQPLKERIIRQVGYGLALEGASVAALVQIHRRANALIQPLVLTSCQL